MNYYTNKSSEINTGHACTAGLSFIGGTRISIGRANKEWDEYIWNDIQSYPWLQGIVDSMDQIYVEGQVDPKYVIDMTGKDLYKLHHLLTWIRVYDECPVLHRVKMAKDAEYASIHERGVELYGMRFTGFLMQLIQHNGHASFQMWNNPDAFLKLFLYPDSYVPLVTYEVSNNNPIGWISNKSDSLVVQKHRLDEIKPCYQGILDRLEAINEAK